MRHAELDRLDPVHRRYRPPGGTSGRLAAELPAETVRAIREMRSAEPGTGVRDDVAGARAARALLDYYLLALYLNGWSAEVLARAYGASSRQRIHDRMDRAQRLPRPVGDLPPVPLPPPTRTMLEEAATPAPKVPGRRADVDEAAAVYGRQLRERTAVPDPGGWSDGQRAASAALDELVVVLVDDHRCDRNAVAAALGWAQSPRVGGTPPSIGPRLRRGRVARAATETTMEAAA